MQRPESNSNTEIDAFSVEMSGIFRRHQLIRRSTGNIRSLSLEKAYEVQERYIAERVSAGERVVGWKVGCTSRAIQQQFGLTQPICGRLLEPHVYSDGAEFSLSDFIHCAVEPELVFHIGRELSEDMDVADLRKSIAGVSAGIELHNYRFWYGKPSSQELIASNGIHAALVLGQRRKLSPETNLDLEQVSILVNGAVAAHGTGAQIMGGPMRSLRWLVQHLANRGKNVCAGDLVIPGSALKLISVVNGDSVEARFTSFGNCKASFHR